MKDNKNELDKLEEAVDQVLAPERAMRWGVRILIAIITLGAVYGVGRVVWHMVVKVDSAVTEVEQQDQQEAAKKAEAAELATVDHNWFVLKKDAIDAATIEVRTRIGDLQRHKVVADNRPLLSFKGKEDRTEASRLEGRIAEAQRARLNLIRDYNAKAAKVDASVLGDLPTHLAVDEVTMSEEATVSEED